MPNLTKLFVAFCFIFNLSAQESDNQQLKIFLDCDACDNTYIRQNLENVQFVRDQNFADVHLFFTTQRNGSGGNEFVVDFIGKGDYIELKDKFAFNTNTNMTNDEVRNLTLKFIKLGLVRYWVKAGKTDAISINIKQETKEEIVSEDVEDPWNYWVFRLGANGNFSGQETRRNSRVNASISARRVTEKNKLFIRASYNENRNVFDFEGEESVTIRNSRNLNINDAISINNHWSIGAFADLRTSIFSNLDFSWGFRPAIEYNFYDYADSAKKQITLSYRNGVRFNDYIELTIFGVTEEYLWEHELSLGSSINQKWGNISGEASFEQFVEDLTLNQLSFRLNANIRIFKGFNFNIGGRYSITSNQVELSAGGVTLEELLLNNQQLPSGFNFNLNLGFNYSFGSIYNTIVNPRFGF
ncbi:hypothetical protein [Winogradskyella immobilis]|uniref:DUF481 domain-containing protein n=1 Tax=Winogradskyella immobilis TaxID=2816852 RepID=A0ABS8EJB5_9FLAO|nr:hypothetical protein [Winogradskyella immobilis]MCC1483304.1 hypothetical protein [Winogradskyella immobilis]MCG0015398.1 hypothetical protein [Winogradskyella immobilis]